jgi:hypothetical protein
MDLKQALSAGIQKQLVNGEIPLDRSEPIEELEGEDCGIEATIVTALETQIRARTRGKGVRYFSVLVTEHL